MPSRIFLAIAVHRPDGGLAQLNGVLKSAERLLNWATANGYTPLRVFDDVLPVTAERIDETLRPAIEAIHKGGHELDRLIVYFAGHGLGDKNNSYWLLSKWHERTTENVMVNGLQRMLRLYHPRQVAVIADACRVVDANLLHVDGNSILGRPKGAPSREFELDRFFAVGEGGQAWAAEAANGSGPYCIFSEVLLRGLKGDEEAIDAELSNRRVVTGTSLSRYLRKAVPEEAAKINKVMEADPQPAFLSDRVYAEFARLTPTPPTLATKGPKWWAKPLLPNDRIVPDKWKIDIDGSGKASIPWKTKPFQTVKARGFIRPDEIREFLTDDSPKAFDAAKHELERNDIRIGNFDAPFEPLQTEDALPKGGTAKQPKIRRAPPEIEFAAGTTGDEPLHDLLAERRGQRATAAMRTADDWLTPEPTIPLTDDWRIVVSGASVRAVSALDGGAIGPQANDIWSGTAECGFADLAVKLEDGREAYVCALRGFTAKLAFSRAGEPSIVYRPSGAAHHRDRDVLSLLARSGAGLLSTRSTGAVAAEVRQEKHADPTLGCVAAYLYDAIVDIDSIRKTASYYPRCGQLVPLDVAILLGETIRFASDGTLTVDISATSRREPRMDAEAARPFTFEPTPAVPNARIAGLRPWMRMGWYALDALLTEGAAEDWRRNLMQQRSMLTAAAFTMMKEPTLAIIGRRDEKADPHSWHKQ